MGIPYFFLKDGTKVLVGTDEAEKVYRRLEQRLIESDPESYKKSPPKVDESNVDGLLSKFEGHWQPSGKITNQEEAERVREYLCDGRSLFSYFSTIAEETKNLGTVPDEFYRHTEIYRNAAAVKQVASEARAWRNGKLLCDVLVWHLLGVIQGVGEAQKYPECLLPRFKGLLFGRSLYLALTMLQLDVPAYEEAGVDLLALKNALADIGAKISDQGALKIISKDAGKLRRHADSEDRAPALATPNNPSKEPATLSDFFSRIDPGTQKKIIDGFRNSRVVPVLAIEALKLFAFVTKTLGQDSVGAGNFNLYVLNAITHAGHTEDNMYLMERVLLHLKDYDYLRHQRPDGDWQTDGRYILTEAGWNLLHAESSWSFDTKKIAEEIQKNPLRVRYHPLKDRGRSRIFSSTEGMEQLKKKLLQASGDDSYTLTEQDLETLAKWNLKLDSDIWPKVEAILLHDYSLDPEAAAKLSMPQILSLLRSKNPAPHLPSVQDSKKATDPQEAGATHPFWYRAGLQDSLSNLAKFIVSNGKKEEEGWEIDKSEINKHLGRYPSEILRDGKTSAAIKWVTTYIYYPDGKKGRSIGLKCMKDTPRPKKSVPKTTTK